MVSRPENNEYKPYFSTYVNLVPEGDLIQILDKQVDETISLLKDLTDDQSHYRYGPDKWTIKEMIGHVADTERIMGYRMLCIARGDTASLPGFDDKVYAINGDFNRLTMGELLENLAVVRKSTILLLKQFTPEAWLRKGNANNSEVTVRALAYIVAGHELHHRRIIKDRYFGSENYPVE